MIFIVVNGRKIMFLDIIVFLRIVIDIILVYNFLCDIDFIRFIVKIGWLLYSDEYLIFICFIFVLVIGLICIEFENIKDNIFLSYFK